MRLHARVGPSPSAPGLACRVLVGGFGLPGMRDLDFGTSFVRMAEAADWPEGTVVEELAGAAHLVLHRLQELRPARAVLVGAVARGTGPAGTIRRYRVAGSGGGSPAEVHHGLCEGVGGGAGGTAGLERVLAVARHWGCLPDETTVVEVEPADGSMGLGFSEELAAVVDEVLALVRDEVGDAHLGPVGPPLRPAPAIDEELGLDQLLDYHRAYRNSRELVSVADRFPASSRLTVAARLRPWGAGARLGADWFDVFPTGDALVGVVMGDADGCGIDAASAIDRLRSAVRALALLEGRWPDRVVRDVHRLTASTGDRPPVMMYLTVDPDRRRIEVAGTGHLTPLLVSPGGRVDTLAPGDGGRSSTYSAAAGSTLLLASDGLVAGTRRSTAEGTSLLRRAAAAGPGDLEAFCDRLVDACLDGRPPAGDASLLAIRLPE